MEPSILTASGLRFHLLRPSVDHICIEDIAQALSNLCRYTGHVAEFYCPTEDQRVLTDDLRWVPAGDLVVGQGLLGFDEAPHEIGGGGNKRRRFRPAVVTHAQRVKRSVITLEMRDGSTVTASEEHPWLIATRKSRNQVWASCSSIAAALGSGKKRYMHKFSNTWEQINTYTAGWLAGMYDGEGYLSAQNRKGTQMGIAQKAGPTLERIVEALIDNGFGAIRYANTGTINSGVVTLQLGGGWREVARLLGSIRPGRLLNKFTDLLRDGNFSKQLDGVGEPMEIVAAHRDGERWVAGIETSTHTYLCEGYAAHNSVAQHSYLVSNLVPIEDAMHGLLHDAAEAYIGDVSSPLKSLLQDYRYIEFEVEAAVCRKFGLPYKTPPSVKRADLVALATEKRDLMPFDPVPWPILDGVSPSARPITPLPPRLARELFLNRYHQLRGIGYQAMVMAGAS